MLRTIPKGNGPDYFSLVADVFYKAQKDVFGDVTDMYSVDPFHEGGSMGDMDAPKVYEKIQNKMLEHDADAVWVIQEWSGSIASSSNIKKLNNLDKEHVLILDLFSEVSPRNSNIEKSGTPWVWNMLHNFGGRMGLDGNPERVSQEVSSTFNKSQYMKGIGMTPEAIENAPMVYELLFDTIWTKDPIDYRAWTEAYAERNYGGTNDDIKEAWNILLDTVYSPEKVYYQGAPESVFNARPQNDFKSASAWGHSTINYDKQDLEKALELIVKHFDEFKGSDAYIYDVADITRQVISNTGLEFYKIMDAAYQQRDLEAYRKASGPFLDMIKVQEKVLSSNEAFLVGPWIEKARNLLPNADDWTKDLFEYNARSLVTTWGSYGQANGYNGGHQSTSYGLADYSNRQWSGLTEDFYYPRWELFVNDTIKAMEENKALPSFNSYNWFMMESKWSTQKSDEGFAYPTHASDVNLKELVEYTLENYTSASAGEYDTVDHNTKVNLALGKEVSLRTKDVVTDPNHPLVNLTDGMKDTSTKITTPSKTIKYRINLGAVYDIEGVEIAMEQVPKEFPYNVIVTAWTSNATGWPVIGTLNDGKISSNQYVETNGSGSYVSIELVTTDSTIIPEIFDIQVFGKKRGEVVEEISFSGSNIASGKPGFVVNQNGEKNTTRLTDGNFTQLENVGSDVFPTTFTVDLEDERDINDVRVHFEKAGIRFQYYVEVEDAQGNKTKILDMTDNVDDLEKSYTIPYIGKASKVHTVIVGRAKGGSFWAASPALAEIEVFNEPVEVIHSSKNVSSNMTLSDEEIEAIKDRDVSTVLDLSGKKNDEVKEFVFDLKETTEIYAFELLLDEMTELHYSVEIKTNDSDEWRVVKNTFNNSKLNTRFVQVFSSDNADQVRLRIENNNAKIQSFNVYAYNASQDLTRYVNDVKKKIQGKSLGENPGDYSKDAKNELDAVIADAEKTAMNHLTRQEAQKEIESVKEAYRAFLSTYVTVDRSQLLLELVEAEALLKMDVLKNNGELKDAYNEAKSVYDTAQVSQTMLDDAKEALSQAKEKALAVLETKDQLDAKLAIAEALVENAQVGDRPGNVSEEVKQALIDSISSVKAAIETAGTNDDLNALISEIEEAVDTFKNSHVVVDKTELKEIVEKAQAENRADYTKDSYEILSNAIANVQSIIDDENASLSEVEGAVALVSESLENLVSLDRSVLEDEIIVAEQLKAEDYAVSSWEVFNEVLNESKEVLAKDSVNQSEIDEAVQALQDATEELVALDRNKLTEVIEKAQKLDSKDYSKEEWTKFMEVLKEAYEIEQTPFLEKEDIDAMVEKLQSAIDGLNKQTEKPTEPTEPVEPTEPMEPGTPNGVINGFHGLAREYQVGDVFVLVPENDDRKGSDGWSYDTDILSATFNSPATFTAKKVGTTTIEYRSLDGTVERMTVRVVAKDTQNKLPSTGISNGNVAIVVVSLLALGVSVSLVSSRRKKSRKQ